MVLNVEKYGTVYAGVSIQMFVYICCEEYYDDPFFDLFSMNCLDGIFF